MIREGLKKDLTKAIKNATGIEIADVHLEHPAGPQYGDYSSNIAMKLAKKLGKPPMEIAAGVVAQFTARGRELPPANAFGVGRWRAGNFASTIERAEVAPPGFINFYLKKEWLQGQVGEILGDGGGYGLNKELRMKNEGTRVQVEFISANPTGPLHIGNARGGFAGDVLANVLSRAGYQVQREYYINDKGVQVERLAQSVKAHYDAMIKGFALDDVDIPEGGYSGDYIGEIARLIYGRERSGEKVESLENFKSFAVGEILKNIKKTLARMGIKFDNFFSEQSLYDTSQVKETLKLLEDKGLVYKKDEATWIKTRRFGDDKDRVLVKSDGEMTYLVSDIAYHWDKFEKRKFDRVILFWGADHHGYVPRFLAMMEAIGHKGKARVELLQLLKLSRGGKEVRMSKRAGEYVTVDDVLDEIGLDAARFHFLMQPLSTPMTLDLEKAKEHSEKNPVYYVQYACARMSSILAKSQKSKIKNQNLVQSSKLGHSMELALIRKLLQLPEVVVDISKSHEVHRLPQYSIEIADAFHRFYENCRVLSEDEELTAVRLGLVKATQIVLAETLGLMGISVPERM